MRLLLTSVAREWFARNVHTYSSRALQNNSRVKTNYSWVKANCSRVLVDTCREISDYLRATVKLEIGGTVTHVAICRISTFMLLNIQCTYSVGLQRIIASFRYLLINQISRYQISIWIFVNSHVLHAAVLQAALYHKGTYLNSHVLHAAVLFVSICKLVIGIK